MACSTKLINVCCWLEGLDSLCEVLYTKIDFKSSMLLIRTYLTDFLTHYFINKFLVLKKIARIIVFGKICKYNKFEIWSCPF